MRNGLRIDQPSPKWITRTHPLFIDDPMGKSAGTNTVHMVPSLHRNGLTLVLFSTR